jgi:hypothetical protein
MVFLKLKIQLAPIITVFSAVCSVQKKIFLEIINLNLSSPISDKNQRGVKAELYRSSLAR